LISSTRREQGRKAFHTMDKNARRCPDFGRTSEMKQTQQAINLLRLLIKSGPVSDETEPALETEADRKAITRSGRIWPQLISSTRREQGRKAFHTMDKNARRAINLLRLLIKSGPVSDETEPALETEADRKNA
jgi:hypothetical protein